MQDLRLAGMGGLDLHLLDHGGSGPLVLLLHGFMEHAHAYDFMAPLVAAEGFRVVALDWRGHGDSAPIGAGGYYHFADYVADLAFVLRALGEPAVLVGHSMGGNACLLHAGTEPDRIRALVNIEGLGPPDASATTTPERYANWISDLERAASRAATPRKLSLEEAEARLARNFPLWSAEVVRYMALHGTRPAGAARLWKVDPLHRTTSPQPFYAAQAEQFWQRIRCPVLYLDGDRSFLSAAPIDLERRLVALSAQRLRLDGCGHHPHLERPAATAAAIVRFLRQALSPAKEGR